MEKWDRLLLFNIFLLFRGDICDQQTPRTCRFVLQFLLLSLINRQDLLSAHKIILTSIRDVLQQ